MTRKSWAGGLRSCCATASITPSRRQRPRRAASSSRRNWSSTAPNNGSRAELGPRSSPGSWGGVYQPVYADGQVADADAGGVVNGIGDRGGDTDDADLADSLGPGGADVRILLVDPAHVDGADVRVDRDVVLGQVVVEVVAELAVQDAFLVQRHRHAPGHPAQ